MTAAEIEKLCKSLRGTTKDIKWGNDLCYSVGEKMYCVTSLKGDPSISFKTSEEIFSELIEREGIIPAPYVARYYWVLISGSQIHVNEGIETLYSGILSNGS